MVKKLDSTHDLSDLRRRAENALNSFPESCSSDLPELDEIRRLLHELNVHKIELEMQNDELRNIQESLLLSRDKYADLYEFAPVAYVTFNRHKHVIEANLTTSRILGLDRSRLVGRTMAAYLAPDDMPRFNQSLNEIFQGNTPQSTELRFIRADSTTFTGLLQSVSVFDESGSVHQCRSVITDITSQKVAEERLYRELEISRAITEMMIALLSPNYAILDLSRVVHEKVKALTGSRHAYVTETDPVTGDQIFLTLNEMLGKGCQIEGPISARFPIGQDGLYPGLWGHTLNTRTSFFTNDPLGHVSSKGLPPGHLPLKNFLSVPVIQEQALVGQIGIANSPQDYTETDIETVERLSKYYALGLLRKHDEETRILLSSAIEQAAEAVVVADINGIHKYGNPAFETITGYSREETIDRPFRFLDPELVDPSILDDMWKTINAGFTWNGNFQFSGKDGSIRDQQLSIAPVRDERGQVKNLVAVVRDVSDEVRLQAQLMQSQKMEIVGTLAGGLAHDFNNVLQVILGYSEIVAGDRRIPTELRADIEIIHHAALSGADLTKRLLLFTRKTQTRLQPLKINDQIQQMRKLLDRTIPKNISINMTCCDDLMAISGDPTQIEQIIMNIALNARDAMPDGGKLEIETTNVFLDEQFCSERTDASPGHYVLLRITDSGRGMNPEIMSHIFEPFFTTKPAGSGTGLGLSIVHGIVVNHRGFITCESSVGLGTTFRIYFPAVANSALSKITHDSVSFWGGTETILVVDDNDQVRSFEEETLKKVGYGVITAADGRQAYEIYRTQRDRIDLVVMDIVMPGMDGEQCLKAIMEFHPGAKIVVCSGLINEEKPARLLKAGAKAHLQKPINRNTFLKTIREVLDLKTINAS